MKLQKQVAYKYKDKTHFKFVLVIPENTIKALGWVEGQNLSLKVESSKLIVEVENKV